ncbi:MAG: sulfatase-like hydrolase/transferase [Fuerstiella sp.]
MRRWLIVGLCLVGCLNSVFWATTAMADPKSVSKPNVVLVMADDMGWGQTGFYNHPVLKTPHLDAMAANGIRFDRFYAGASNCSPTRATVMTGRTNDRTGVQTHGYALRPQERTIAQVMAANGYSTGHFGKWHLNGMRGPGAPILKDDIRSPGRFGFEEWVSVTNFFDRNPIMSRKGGFEEFEGDSSEIAVAEAVKFISTSVRNKQPFFSVIWYGTPHSPFVAGKDDEAIFGDLKKDSANHYGELVAMDRSIGTLRTALRDLNVADNTLFWFCSDNGGLPKITPATVGGLRGFKNSLYEGGLRVPSVIEWPNAVKPGQTVDVPACTVDILPTVMAATGAKDNRLPKILDGISLVPAFQGNYTKRSQPIGFRHTKRHAWIDHEWKLVQPKPNGNWELYHLVDDFAEERNLISEKPAIAQRMKKQFEAWNKTIEQSIAGADYPGGKVVPADPEPVVWTNLPQYAPYLDEWKSRPEFKSYINRQNKK